MTFLELLRSKPDLDVDLIIGGRSMAATFVWGEDNIITEYGIEKYRPLLDAEYTVHANGKIRIHCDDYKLGKDFCMAAAGYIGITEHNKIFGEQ